MIRILTSDFKNYEKKDGIKITRPMSNENGLVDQLKNALKRNKKVVFVSSDINSTPDSVESYARIFFDSMKMVGITFEEYCILDGTKVNKSKEYIENADLVFLCGGDTYNQHLLFEKINLKLLLSTYSGVVMGQSAGAINMAEHCFNSPEELEESEPVFFEGLGLTNINIEPHFVYDTSRFNENEKYQRKVIIDESYNRPIYGQCNGSHVFIDENNIATIYGETYLIINGNIEITKLYGDREVPFYKGRGRFFPNFSQNEELCCERVTVASKIATVLVIKHDVMEKLVRAGKEFCNLVWDDIIEELDFLKSLSQLIPKKL